MGVEPALLTELALLGVFLGTVLPFAPAEPALISGGALAAAGEVSLAAVLGVAVVGSVVCDLVTYRAGWAVGPPMLRRMQRRAKLSDAISWTQARLAEGAGIKLVGLRVVPSGGFVVPMVCGTFRMPLRQFLLISTVGSAAFSVRAAMLGFVGGWIAGDLFVGLVSSFLVALLLTAAASWLTRHHAAPKQTKGAIVEDSVEDSVEEANSATDTASASA
ncbi:MAG TPA: VTT domain-containing protein [Pseudonocardiaceae bacterium]|nr:VTT domain-containing protein [Pseudonocardiaceae bacterium]